MRFQEHVVLAAALLLSGCASTTSQATLQDVTKKYSDAVSAQSVALSTELASRPRVRRHEAIEKFITTATIFKQGDDDYKTSFAQYVCAGDNAFHKARSFLAFAKSYSAESQQIITPGADTFAGQLSKYEELNRQTDANTPGNAASAQPMAQAKDCIAIVKGYSTFEGYAPDDRTDEVPALAAIPAAYASFQALFDAVQAVAKDGLKIVNEVEARKRLKEYVEKMHPQFDGALATDLDPNLLSKAWDRRKAQSLWSPYLTFATLVKLRGNVKAMDVQHQYQMKELTLKLDSELAEYDAMAASAPPADVVKRMAAAEAAVYNAARDQTISLDTIKSFLDEAISDAKTAEADYKNVSTAATNAQTAISNLVQ